MRDDAVLRRALPLGRGLGRPMTSDQETIVRKKPQCPDIVKLVRSLELATVGSLKEECFQAALESWRETHQLQFCWQPVPRLGCSDGERPLTEFQTGPGDDIIAIGRRSESGPRWDIG